MLVMKLGRADIPKGVTILTAVSSTTIIMPAFNLDDINYHYDYRGHGKENLTASETFDQRKLDTLEE
jgi:hypothetical protein